MRTIIYFICIYLGAANAFAVVVPTKISPDQIEGVAKKFTGLLSINSSNSPTAAGADFEFELTGVYQDLELNDIESFQPVSSDSLLEAFATVRKGLYLNFDLSFSFALPVEGNMTSSYSLNLSHSSRLGSLYLKPEIFILNYTLNDILNISSSGLSLIAYHKVGAIYIGLGGRLESSTGTYEENFLEENTLTSSGENKVSFLTSSAVLKIFFEKNIYRATLSYAFSDEKKSEAAFSIGFIL